MIGLLITLLIFVACGTSTASPVSTPEPAYPFTLDSLDGPRVSLADFQGKRVLLNFWATWCGPCLTEMPLLQAYHTAHIGKIVILGVNMRENPDSVREAIARMGIAYPILLNPDDAISLNYGLRGLPRSFLIGPDGTLLKRYFGPITAEQLKELAQNG